MKIFLLLIIGIVGNAYALDNKYVDMSSTSLAATYSASYPQKTLTAVTNGNLHAAVINYSASKICCTPSGSSAPTESNTLEKCVPPTFTMTWDFLAIGPNFYCRSFSGTLSTSAFEVQTW